MSASTKTFPAPGYTAKPSGISVVFEEKPRVLVATRGPGDDPARHDAVLIMIYDPACAECDHGHGFAFAMTGEKAVEIGAALMRMGTAMSGGLQ